MVFFRFPYSSWILDSTGTNQNRALYILTVYIPCCCWRHSFDIRHEYFSALTFIAFLACFRFNLHSEWTLSRINSLSPFLKRWEKGKRKTDFFLFSFFFFLGLTFDHLWSLNSNFKICLCASLNSTVNLDIVWAGIEKNLSCAQTSDWVPGGHRYLRIRSGTLSQMSSVLSL